MISKLLMCLLLAIVAYMIYMFMLCDNKNNSTEESEDSETEQESTSTSTSAPTATTASEAFTNGKINYEKFENSPGQIDPIKGAAPAAFKSAVELNADNYATVNYTGLVEANPEDVLQIEGTDLLTAPLVDNMLYTNSIANTNRNASQDLRGDLPLQFNESYTPFYSSVIYGAPLSERTMTIGGLPSSGPVGPIGPFTKGITATA
jgi:hypothetical protein